MPTLLHEGALVFCQHNGMAQPMMTYPRVCVSNQPIVVQTALYSISGCSNSVPPGPCVTAQWVMAAKRVKANNIPVLLKNSQAICVPTGTGLSVRSTQVRVQGE
jgi:hypothetical protein